jgi:hypothetical protein
MPDIVSSVSWIDLSSMIVLPIVLPAAIGYFTNTTKIPAFWKRLILFLLAFATTALTELIDSVSSGSPYDIGMSFLRALATYLAAEGVYHGFLKAPLNSAPQTVASLDPIEGWDALTVTQLRKELGARGLNVDLPTGTKKADLIAMLEKAEPPLQLVEGTPTLATMIQSHGVQ